MDLLKDAEVILELKEAEAIAHKVAGLSEIV
jgi:hypothetical protein